jgi:hypothetical protein
VPLHATRARDHLVARGGMCVYVFITAVPITKLFVGNVFENTLLHESPALSLVDPGDPP